MINLLDYLDKPHLIQEISGEGVVVTQTRRLVKWKR